MEQGPFRSSPRSTGRGVDAERSSLSESTRHTESHHTEPKPVHRATSRSPFSEKKSNKKLYVIIATAIVVVLVAVLAFVGISKFAQSGTAIDGGKYQAVFFTNGQVYFGKLQQFNSEYMRLTDVFYLQTQAATGEDDDSKNPQQTSNDQNGATLIKLGDEIHGPEDEMIISKDQVLFYENLKKDGKVSQSIDKYKNPN